MSTLRMRGILPSFALRLHNMVLKHKRWLYPLRPTTLGAAVLKRHCYEAQKANYVHGSNAMLSGDSLRGFAVEQSPHTHAYVNGKSIQVSCHLTSPKHQTLPRP